MTVDEIENTEIKEKVEDIVKDDQNLLSCENSIQNEGQECAVLNEEIRPDLHKCVCEENANPCKEVNKENKILFNHKLVVRIFGFKRLSTIAEEMKLYYTFFTEEMGISPPYIEIPAQDDDHVLFQVKSEEDRKKLFTKMSRKIYIWKSYKLEMKGLPWLQRSTDLGRLPLKDALKILYPYKDHPYGQQLKEKTELAEVIIDLIFPKRKLSDSSTPEVQMYKIEPILPMTSAEGYDYHITFGIEEDPETKEVIAGIRVTSEDNEKGTVVPIDLCLSVPHQISLVLKDFVKHLPDFGLRPYDHKMIEGNILGVTLQMTMSSHFIMTVMTPTAKSELRQLEPDVNKEEGSSTKEIYSYTIRKNEQDIIEKLEKYFQIHGKQLGIDSIYLISMNARESWFISDDNSIPEATHILGEVSILDNYNGILVPVTWSNDLIVNNSLKPILNVIEERCSLNNNSRIYLISSCRFVALYLAKKYKHIKMFCESINNNLNILTAWSKSTGIDNIEFADYSKFLNPSSISKDNAVVIVWQSTQPTLVRQLLDSGITNLILVSYWKKDPSLQHLKKYQNQLEVIAKKLDVSYIYPIDVAPYTERHGLIAFFGEREAKSSWNKGDRSTPKRDNQFEVGRNKRRRASTWYRRKNRFNN